MIWKKKAGKNLPVSVAKELMAVAQGGARARRRPAVGRTAKQVTGLQGPLRPQFRAKLKIEPRDDEGKWQVDFDEEWAVARAPSRRGGRRPRPPAGRGEARRSSAERTTRARPV